MFDRDSFENTFAEYKRTFATEKWWNDENFKWIAIKQFQNHWDVNLFIIIFGQQII